MITEAGLTVANVRARAVNITLERPVQTSGGEIPTAPLVLIDLERGRDRPDAPTSSPIARSLLSP